MVGVLLLVPVEKMMGNHKDLFTSKSPSQASDNSTVVEHLPLHFNIFGSSPATGAGRENGVKR